MSAGGNTPQLRAVGGQSSTSKRKLSSWIDGFYEYTAAFPSPELFRRWAGISLIAGVLEQRVWLNAGFGTLYPNLYVILVAPPGVGKTAVTGQVWDMWETLVDKGNKTAGLHLAASSLTSASIIDELRDATRNIVRPRDNPPTVSFNSLAICSNELGVLLPSYENDFMNKLTDIYDNRPYSERRRTKELNFSVPRPQLNLLAATTPGYLTAVLPEGAWDQGFLSRTILVYSGEQLIRPLFNETTAQKSLHDQLLADLRHVFTLYGKMEFTPGAAQLINNWHLAGGPPKPDHPRLYNYNTRRTAHLLKLCMVACAESAEDLIITEAHFTKALDWLLEAEAWMPDIFKSMAVGGDKRAIQDCWHFCRTVYMAEKKPIAEHRIAMFLQERVPAHNVARIIQVMEQAHMIKEGVAEPGVGKVYIPEVGRVGG